jgi:N,N'-diacetyllegionaminate synthase
MLVGLGQEMFKIPSGEITNLPYLRHIGQLKKRVILSTGMSSVEEIKAALGVLEKSGTERTKITVLHCTTAYPVPIQEVNLRAMQTIQSTLDVSIGYSDHTLGIEIPIAAVALGATVIEKHFTLNRTLKGTDHAFSLEPQGLSKLVRDLDRLHLALGDGAKRQYPSEFEPLQKMGKKIVFSRNIGLGETITEADLDFRSPGDGISPWMVPQLIGKKLKKAMLQEDSLRLEDLE